MTTNQEYNLTQTLVAAFDFFNSALFGDSLPPAVITVQRHKGARGYFSPQAFATRLGDAATAHEIALNPDSFDRTDREILSTLVHEMCHLWQQTHGKPSRSAYHNKQWATEMLRVGLQPVSVDNPGKMTGQKVTHEIVDGGPYARAYADFMQFGYSIHWRSRATDTATQSAKTKIKYTCHNCEANAWGKPDLRLICGDCEELMLVDAE
jgi:predicted SprT family Zn-dependent metalloprotease